ncbi:hypothetical protein DXG01_010395 [Tephrocybe rancida]|nr:hypothetical protein DXG01_010395 [Tephrocybe rancida]
MRFSNAIFVAAALLFAGVAQAMPQRLQTESLSARGPYGNEILERGLFADEDLTPRMSELDTEIYHRELDNVFETRDYISKRFDFLENNNVLEARTDTCPICLDKIRAPDKLYSFCSNSASHEACGHCLTKMLTELQVNCPICRNQMNASNFSSRVCKERTPSPEPQASTSKAKPKRR